MRGLVSSAEACPCCSLPLFVSLRQKLELGEKGGKVPCVACQTRVKEGKVPHRSAGF